MTKKERKMWNFFMRFLKEKGMYKAYMKELFIWQRKKYSRGFSGFLSYYFKKEHVREFGIGTILCDSIVWTGTREQIRQWMELDKSFNISFDDWKLRNL